MQKLNNTLQYIYYLVGLSWLVWGIYSYFLELEKYHQTLTTVVYGLLIMLGIFYVGVLHKKASTGNVVIFPVISIINIILILLFVFIYFLTPEGNELVVYMLGGILGIVSFLTLCSGALEVKKIWPKSVFLTISLVILLIAWTYIFTSF